MPGCGRHHRYPRIGERRPQRAYRVHPDRHPGGDRGAVVERAGEQLAGEQPGLPPAQRLVLAQPVGQRRGPGGDQTAGRHAEVLGKTEGCGVGEGEQFAHDRPHVAAAPPVLVAGDEHGVLHDPRRVDDDRYAVPDRGLPHRAQVGH